MLLTKLSWSPNFPPILDVHNDGGGGGVVIIIIIIILPIFGWSFAKLVTLFQGTLKTPVPPSFSLCNCNLGLKKIKNLAIIRQKIIITWVHIVVIAGDINVFFFPFTTALFSLSNKCLANAVPRHILVRWIRPKADKGKKRNYNNKYMHI